MRISQITIIIFTVVTGLGMIVIRWGYIQNDIAELIISMVNSMGKPYA